MFSNVDPEVVKLILALFGIGLVPLINFLKKLIGVEGKPAVLLVIACSAGATAVTLLVTSAFAWTALITYTLAVLGEVTGLFKLSKGTIIGKLLGSGPK